MGSDAEDRGDLVLTLSVIVILLTAPAGAIGIAIAGPAWLERDMSAAEPIVVSSSAGVGGGTDSGAAKHDGEGVVASAEAASQVKQAMQVEKSGMGGVPNDQERHHTDESKL